MKKTLLALVTALFMTSASAAVWVDYVCSSPDFSYINKIDIQGSFDLQNGVGQFEAFPLDMSLETMSAGYASTLFFEDYELSGEMKYYAPGVLAKGEIFHLQSVNKNPDSEIKLVNLLIGHPGQLSSQVVLKNGTTFKGRCHLKITSF